MQHRGNVVHFIRMIGCAAAAALMVALPVAAHDRDHDRGRGNGHGHDHGVDELAAELRALKERVRKLEGHLTRDEVAGSYVFRSLQVAMTQPSVGRLEHLAATGAMELNANGSFTLSASEGGFNAIWQFPTTRNRVDRADSQSGTWTYQDGVIYLTFDGGEVVPFGGAVGGRMFMLSHSNPADGTTTFATLVKRVQ